MQAFNELRREGVRKLTESMLCRYRRDLPQTGKRREEIEGRIAGETPLPGLSFLVQSVEQLETALGCEYADVIYIDSLLGCKAMAAKMLKDAPKAHKYYLAMPYIFRGEQADRWEKSYSFIEETYDGVLIRNWESFQWLKDHGYKGKICSDANLYVFNGYGKTFIKRQGIHRFTVPAELNAGELKEMGVQGAVWNVYGYQPVMVTANCIQKTGGKCTKEEGYIHIRDRCKKQFAVWTCCSYCYNVIYNSAPLFLADKAEEIIRLGPGELRLDFTVEGSAAMERIMEVYIDAFVCRKEVEAPAAEYTRGHFKRGVK